MSALSLGLALVALASGSGCGASPVEPEPLGAEREGEITVLFFGDAGSHGPLQHGIAESMAAVCKRLDCDIGLVLGDLVYAATPIAGPDDPQLAASLGSVLAPLRAIDGLRLYAVAGNHDVLAGLAPLRAFAAADALLEWPALHYPIPALPDWLRVYGLFTPSIFEADVAAAGGDARLEWSTQTDAARAYLCADAPGGWRILFGHHPIHSSAHGAAKRMGPRLLPLIRRCDVQLYLAGHAHQQEHIHTDDFEQLIQGAASDPRPARGWFKRGPRTTFLSEAPGFGVLRASPDALQVRFFGADGSAIYGFALAGAGAPRPAAAAGVR